MYPAIVYTPCEHTMRIIRLSLALPYGIPGHRPIVCRITRLSPGYWQHVSIRDCSDTIFQYTRYPFSIPHYRYHFSIHTDTYFQYICTVCIYHHQANISMTSYALVTIPIFNTVIIDTVLSHSYCLYIYISIHSYVLIASVSTPMQLLSPTSIYHIHVSTIPAVSCIYLSHIVRPSIYSHTIIFLARTMSSTCLISWGAYPTMKG